MKSAVKIVFRCICFALVLSLVACGGGGDSGPGVPGQTYTGLTSAAVLTATNADDVAFGAVQGGTAGTAVSVFGAQGGVSSQDTYPARLFPLVKSLQAAISQVDPAQASTRTSAKITVSESLPTTCGGSANFTINVDEFTFDFTGTMTFSRFCTDDGFITGTTSFSGTYDVSGDTIGDSLTMTLNRVTVESGGDSVTSSGTVVISGINSTTQNVSISMVMLDNNTQQTFWVSNYQVSVFDASTYEEITVISGRFYHPDFGFVDLATQSGFPLLIDVGSNFPRAGILVLTGDNGVVTTIEFSATSATANSDDGSITGEVYIYP